MTFCDFLNPAVPLGKRVRHDLGVTFAGACTVAICRTLQFQVLHRPQSDSIPCVVGFRNGTMTAEDWHQLHREAARVAMLSTKAQRKMPVLT